MGQAFDRDGQVLGEAFGETKREVFDKLSNLHPHAHEIRIKSLQEKLDDVERSLATEQHVSVSAVDPVGREGQEGPRATDAFVLDLQSRLAAAEASATALREIIWWALGEAGEFPAPPDDWSERKYKPWFWWRRDMRQRLEAALQSRIQGLEDESATRLYTAADLVVMAREVHRRAPLTPEQIQQYRDEEKGDLTMEAVIIPAKTLVQIAGIPVYLAVDTIVETAHANMALLTGYHYASDIGSDFGPPAALAAHAETPLKGKTGEKR